MRDPFFLCVVTGFCVGGAAGYLGSLMITRRMALVGDALGHVALPGMGLALLLGFDPSLGAFFFLALATFLIWGLGEGTSLSQETLVGVLFITSLAVGFLIVPRPELLESLVGDITRLTPRTAALSITFSIATALGVMRLYPGLTLMAISSDLAEVSGVSRRRYNFLYLGAISLMVALGVRVTGTLLVGALVIVPAAAARLISSDLKKYAGFSALIGAVSCAAGVVAAHLTPFPPGPAMILICAAVFAVAAGRRWLKTGRAQVGSD